MGSGGAEKGKTLRRILDNTRGSRYNTLDVSIKGQFALNIKEGMTSWQIRNTF